MPTAAQHSSKRSIAKTAAKKPAVKAVASKKRVSSKKAAAPKAVAVKQTKKAGSHTVHIVSAKITRKSVADVVKELAQSYGFEIAHQPAKASANPYAMSADKAKRVLRGAGVVTKSGKLSSLYK